MDIRFLGTGNAIATKCYNTCFLLSEGENHFLVDGGGGNTILNRLEGAGVQLGEVRHIFLTHKHIDHIFGVVWMVRKFAQEMHHGSISGDAFIYGNSEALDALEGICRTLLREEQAAFIGARIRFVRVSDGESMTIGPFPITFFDLHSEGVCQYGFRIDHPSGKSIVCLGDEPYHPQDEKYVRNCDYLLCEAFCLQSQVESFHPYEKHHSTVRDACRIAEELGVKNLFLYHTEDRNLSRRKELYCAEGGRYFHGNLSVPDDMESVHLF